MLGAGSMGDVVRGEDIDLKRPVAIKILSEKHRENEELRARFVREARAVAKISHANVVQVFTTGTHDDRPYIAMELLEGVDLATLVKERGTMTSVQAARAILDASRGLQAAAQAGLIHRDVKPSNLVLLESGIVKVTDFGLAKPLEPGAEPALTAMGVVVGTPDYIAPEQARGDPIDERVDIYALGGTLFFLLAGAPPFRKGNPQEDKYLKVVARHLREPPPDPRLRNKTTDDELGELCMQMMAKKQVDRPDYDELIDRLSAIVDRLQSGGAGKRQPSTSGLISQSGLSPTPFVGGDRRIDDDDDPDESAATNIRPSARAHRDTRHPPKPKLSGWLVGTTVFAVLIFLTGLGLMLFGPLPEPAVTAAPVPDAAPPPPDAEPEVKPPPEPPEGFLLLSDPNGKPLAFVSKTPVTYGDYSAMFPGQKPKTRNRRKNRQAVVKVSYVYAEAFAKGKQARLPTPQEWEAASKLPEFESAGDKLFEWTNDGTTGEQAPRALRAPGKQARRRPHAAADVTFRLAMDLPE